MSVCAGYEVKYVVQCVVSPVRPGSDVRVRDRRDGGVYAPDRGPRAQAQPPHRRAQTVWRVLVGPARLQDTGNTANISACNTTAANFNIFKS